jgi:hypothetical protein
VQDKEMKSGPSGRKEITMTVTRRSQLVSLAIVIGAVAFAPVPMQEAGLLPAFDARTMVAWSSMMIVLTLVALMLMMPSLRQMLGRGDDESGALD